MKIINKILSGWTNGVWQKEDKDAAVIKAQKTTIYIVVSFCLLFAFGWMHSPSKMTVYIPPDISNGATLKAGEIPAPLIYSFAYEVWQEINYWPTDGSNDYQNNLRGYWSYLTPSFKSDLLQDYNDLKSAGQVQRQRYMQGIAGAAYDSSLIKKISDNTWEVDLKMRLTEYKNSQPVKDVEILYPIKVTRLDVSQRYNPYGLALAGFAYEPVRLKTYI
jgi:integrating conjugative element protein (TIGR03746 family)